MVDKELVRDAIVDASRQIFGRLGFRGTTMDDIAREVRKGKSSIYYYFKCKEDIYKAVIEKEALFIQAEVSKALAIVPSPAEKLKTYISVRLQLFLQTASFYEAVRSEFLSNLEFINTIREKYDREEEETVKNLLVEGIKANEFVDINTELASVAIVTAIKGIEIPLLKFTENEEAKKRIDNLIFILFNGLSQR